MKLEWDFSELTEFANNLANVGEFEKHAQRITKDIAKALLKCMKQYTPADTYELINGWNGNQFAVTKNGDYYEVLIVNKTPYALYVNDGHKSYNQYGGAYPIKKRIQVRSPHSWQKGDATYYVYGHFFVERGIVTLKNTKQIEAIIMRELQKWWDSL